MLFGAAVASSRGRRRQALIADQQAAAAAQPAPAQPAVAPAEAQSAPASQNGLSEQLEQLEQLGDLLGKGLLTQAEFDAKKKEILGL